MSTEYALKHIRSTRKRRPRPYEENEVVGYALQGSSVTRLAVEPAILQYVLTVEDTLPLFDIRNT